MSEHEAPGKRAALVNIRSGGRRAAVYVRQKLIIELGEQNVFTLFSSPDPTRFVQDAQEFLISRSPDFAIVAGGDGTMLFAMDIIKDLHDKHRLDTAKCVVAPFPLGTGNDLSCTLGYGGGFARLVVLGAPRFRTMMRLFRKSKVVQLDRWHLKSAPVMAAAATQDASCTAKLMTMNNYASIGFDARCARRLNEFRGSHPQYFPTRQMVKLWYAYFAAESLITDGTLNGSVEIKLDGKILRYPANTKSLVVSNMITYAGGSILWGPNNKTERSLYGSPSLSDGKVEVAALSGVWHLAFVRLGWCYATKLGQGEHVEILSAASNHHQCDGEPLIFTEEELKGARELRFDISYFSNSDVLQARLPRRHVFSILISTLVVITAILLAAYRCWLAVAPIWR